MERNVEMNKVIKELNWKEKILVKIFAKTFYKVYKSGVEKGFYWKENG